MLFERQIADLILNGFKKWLQKNVRPLDLDGDGQSDIDEIYDHACKVVDSCEAAFKSADIGKITSGASAVHHGVRTILEGIDYQSALDGAVAAKKSVAEIAKLVGLLFVYFAPSSAAARAENQADLLKTVRLPKPKKGGIKEPEPAGDELQAEAQTELA